MGTTRDYTIESLDTGLRLMRLFLTHDSLTVSEAAVRLSVGRSTAHRVLSTLEGRGFAIRDSSGRGYSPGPELVRLGRPAGFGTDVREQVGAVLDDAVRRTGETVQSAALIGDRIVVTDGRESPHPVRVVLEPGRTHPAHATSGGRMLLSRMTTEQVCALYPRERLDEDTPHPAGFAVGTARRAGGDPRVRIRPQPRRVGAGHEHGRRTADGFQLAGPARADGLRARRPR